LTSPATIGIEANIPRDLCDALGSARGVPDIVDALLEWTNRVIPAGLRTARISLLEEAGRLRKAGASGDAEGLGRERSARRRAAMDGLNAQVIDLRSSPGQAVAFLPLTSQDEAVGILELAGSRAAIDETRETLESLANLGGLALRKALERDAIRRDAQASARSAELVDRLLRVPSREDALVAAVDFCQEHLRVPVAGWLSDGDAEPFFLISSAGFAARARSDLERTMPVLDRGGYPAADWQDGMLRAFRAAVSLAEAELIEAGDAVLGVGVSRALMPRSLRTIGLVLGATVDHLRVVDRAERRNRVLDTGLAWTAHEVRRPLLGARTVMDQLLHVVEHNEYSQLAERAQRELRQLSEDVEALLRWAVGEGSLRRRRTDLVRLVNESVAAAGVEDADERVVVEAREPVTVLADRAHLRGAFSNVVRNALEYSVPGERVNVRLREEKGCATLNVLDGGPGIPFEERRSIFDPFVRGQAAGRRAGSGLGLFITRRVIEAHGGSIWLEPTLHGASFTIRLPSTTDGRSFS
jgi:signal transduction histidine kinase